LAELERQIIRERVIAGQEHARRMAQRAVSQLDVRGDLPLGSRCCAPPRRTELEADRRKVGRKGGDPHEEFMEENCFPQAVIIRTLTSLRRNIALSQIGTGASLHPGAARASCDSSLI
jgi:hypothetical protein